MRPPLGLGPPRSSPRLARARVASDGALTFRPSPFVLRASSQPEVHSAASDGVHGMPRTFPRFTRSSAALAMADGAAASSLCSGGPFMRRSLFQTPSAPDEAAAADVGGRFRAVAGGPFFGSGNSRSASDGADALLSSPAAPRACPQTEMHSSPSYGVHGMPRTSPRFVRPSAAPAMAGGAVAPSLGSGVLSCDCRRLRFRPLLSRRLLLPLVVIAVALPEGLFPGLGIPGQSRVLLCA